MTRLPALPRYSPAAFVIMIATFISLATAAWAQTVTITTPTTGSTLPSPVHIHATYSGTAKYMKLWLNGLPSTVQTNTSTFDVTMAIPAGAERIVVQAADANTGTVHSSSPVNITVTTGGNQQVTFVTPLANATVTSPVHVRFTYGGTASYMKLWVDGVAQASQHDPQVYDTTISLANGTHKLSGQAHDAASGITLTTNENITVGGTGTGVTVSPSNVTLAPGGTQQFTANVSVTWSATGDGTINSSGLFTAGSSPGSATVTATATNGSGATGTANVTVGTAATGNYTTWKNNNLRTGLQNKETALTPANVNSTHFGIKFSESVDGYVYAQPLYMSGLTVNGATHNVVFVATENDSMYAFDADNGGAALWKKSLLMGGVPIPQANVGSTIFGGIGITSTPVIDPNTNTIYVVAETLEGSNYIFRLHALDVTTGAEKFGGPKVISDPNFQPKEQLQRSALLLANGNVYFAFASQGDHSPWHGWIFAYSAGSLSKVAAFNATSTGSAGGIWGGGNAMAADSDGNIFAASGNGDWNGTTNYSMSYIKLSPNLSVLDYFTPFNEATLSRGDRDLGSGGLLLVPTLSGSHPHILIGCGKPVPIYVVDRDDMGHLHAGVDSQIIQELPNVIGGTSGTQSNDPCFMSPAIFQNNLYFIGNNDVMKAFKLDPSTGLISSTPTSKGSFEYVFPGAQPVVSSNGTSNGIVWAVDHATASALHAVDASNVSHTLYTSPSLGTGAKWAVPTVVNGKVYVGTKGHLYVFALH